jgi:glycosyltransferase involved in cell wall biosynthesis
MKILFTVTTDIIYDQRVKRIATALAEAGHIVKVIGRNKKRENIHSVIFHTDLISCFFNRSFLFYAEFNLRLFFKLIFSKCDVICACDLDTLPAATLATMFKKNKLVFDAHEYFEESVEIVNKPFIRKVWKWIGAICIPKTQLRYTVSQTLADLFSIQHKATFRVIRNLSAKSDMVQIEKRQPVIWYQGAINEGRGLELIIELMPQLNNYTFLMAGAGDVLHALREKVNSMKLQDRVIFKGMLHPDELKKYASHSFVGMDLLESKSKSYLYSLSNKTFDYIQAGLPCIQMNFPEYKLIHENFSIGPLLNKLDKDSIIEAIKKLEDPDYYNACITACKEAAEVYDWDKEKLKLIEWYNDLRIN